MENIQLPSKKIAITPDGRHLCILPRNPRHRGVLYFFRDEEGRWKRQPVLARGARIDEIFLGLTRNSVCALTKGPGTGPPTILLWEYRKDETGNFSWVVIQNLTTELDAPAPTSLTLAPFMERIHFFSQHDRTLIPDTSRPHLAYKWEYPRKSSIPRPTTHVTVTVHNRVPRKYDRETLNLAYEKGKLGFYFMAGGDGVMAKQPTVGLYPPPAWAKGEFSPIPPAWSPWGQSFFCALEEGGIQEYEVFGRNDIMNGTKKPISFRAFSVNGHFAKEQKVSGMAVYVNKSNRIMGIVILDENGSWKIWEKQNGRSWTQILK